MSEDCRTAAVYVAVRTVIPVSERSKVGVFDDIMIDIGDEQSIENDLSTYSSHLLNMKNMMRRAGEATLLLSTSLVRALSLRLEVPWLRLCSTSL